MIALDIITLFPEMFEACMNISIIGRAVENGIISINTVNIRDFSEDKHKRVDDYPYGGGAGMVIQPEPVYKAFGYLVNHIKLSKDDPGSFKKPRVVYVTPQGYVFNQNMAYELSQEEDLIILCGHYEGIDERVIEKIVDEEISIGDYVLTGGELPAMVLIDAISRCIPGVLSSGESYTEESLYNGLLEYPQYTRPYDFLGMKVPDVLLSGHHSNIKKWRYKQSLLRTYLKRADLFEKLELSPEDLELLKEALEDISG